MNNATIRDLCTDLLTATVEVLTPDPMDNLDPRTTPPARHVVEHGPLAFAWDCEMVAVACSQVRLLASQDDPRGGRGSCVVIPSIALAAWVVRCWPAADDQGDPPDADAITDAAQVLTVDAASLAGGIIDLWSAGDLFPTAGVECGQVSIDPGMEPLGPSGGLAGWRLTMTVRF